MRALPQPGFCDSAVLCPSGPGSAPSEGGVSVWPDDRRDIVSDVSLPAVRRASGPQCLCPLAPLELRGWYSNSVLMLPLLPFAGGPTLLFQCWHVGDEFSVFIYVGESLCNAPSESMCCLQNARVTLKTAPLPPASVCPEKSAFSPFVSAPSLCGGSRRPPYPCSLVI